ncbi:T9SS type A sorting domain-containing protein [Halocola ammonii]
MNRLYTLKACFIAALLMVSGFASAQLTIDEDFASPGLPSGWTAIDEDGLTPAVDPSFTTWFVDTVNATGPYQGTIHAQSTSWIEGFAPGNRNWLISSAVEVDANTSVAWAAAPAQGYLYMDGYTVLVSTTDTELESFTDTLEHYAQNINDDPTQFSDGVVHGNWVGDPTSTDPLANGIMVHREFSLADYEGETIYIAFLHDSDDDFFLLMDYVKVGNAGDITHVGSVDKKAMDMEVFPNPINEELNLSVTTDGFEPYTIEVRNMVGQLVYSKEVTTSSEEVETLSASDWQAGVYLVSVVMDNDIMTRRVVKK